jgi:stage II sporulation protein D
VNFSPSRRRVASAAVAAAALTTALVVPLVVAAGPVGAQTIAVAPRGALLVSARGNGHGHGMSQYGARGAAAAGKSYRQILAFYYQRTHLTTMRKPAIRVHLSGVGPATTVAAYATTRVTGVRGTLPDDRSGVKRYRLIANRHSGLTLQRLTQARGATWKNYRFGLPDGAAFHQANGRSTKVFSSGGGSTRYYGFIRAYRTSAIGMGRVDTVDRVSLNRYTAGVVPREMPSSWARAAVDAQAVAARTYGMYAVLHPQAKHWDICADTNCQVYGGHQVFNARGQLIGTDFIPAATATSNQVLTYQGSVIFAQFSASDGGWASSGGEPYLTAHQDPFDSSAAGDPWASTYTSRVSVRSVAAYYGLAKLTRITVLSRDGHGVWGGRVQNVRLTGTNSSGRTTRINTTGPVLQWALGLGTDWFTLKSA